VGLNDPNISNPRASPDITTDYILHVRSQGGGCRNNDTARVIASQLDSSIQLQGKDAFCITTGDTAVLVVNPTQSIQWWKGSSAIAGAIQPRYKVTQSGAYQATLVNSDGCTLKTAVENIIVETPRPAIRYPLQYAVMNFPVQLNARNFGESVLWSPATYLDDPGIVSPQFNSPVLQDQIYNITITTTLGCVTVDTQMVKVIKEVKIYVPTAFTPNNDGRNDYLRPIMEGIKELHYFRVFNRWGQVVYNMGSDERGWDGTVGGQIQQTGVFVWVVSGLGLDGRPYLMKGTVTLIR
jgi:gliding motility-associated-like protein